MDAKQIKSVLKDAREAIKNNDNKSAIEKCKEVLKSEKNNYMALVLLGAAYQETDRAEAAKYLRDAVKFNSKDPTVALQGLLSCADVGELPDIIQMLLKRVPEKYSEYHSKLINTGSRNEKIIEKCFNILKDESELENSPDRQQSALIHLAAIFLNQPDLINKSSGLYKTSLEAVITTDENQNQLECFKKYLKLVYKLEELETLAITSDKMIEKYPDEIYPLEWICLSYAEHYDSSAAFTESLKNPIDHYMEKILNLNENSSLGLLVKGIELWKSEKYVPARDMLQNALKIQPNLKICHKFMAQCYMKVGAFGLALNSFEQSKEEKSFSFSQCLYHNRDNVNRVQEAVDIFRSFENDAAKHFEARKYLVRSLNFLGKKEESLKYLKQLKDLGKLEDALFLEAESAASPTEALALLETVPNPKFEENMLKGKLYFEMKQFDKSCTAFLDATKERSIFSECFLWLGKVYLELRDEIRSKKCFEKCVNLDPQKDAAIKLLSAIYRKNEEWDLNYRLLQTTAKYYTGTSCSWVFLQLGLHNLSIKNPTEAMQAFQSALRCNDSDLISKEGLADSYYQQGMFWPAMKTYESLVEMDVDNPYPKLQVARIKTLLGMFDDATKDFKILLEIHPNYLPALKGSAEAHFETACNLYSQRLLGRCKDHLQEATDDLQKIFESGRNGVWLWRLLGKVFELVGKLPASKASLKVHGKFAGQEEDVVDIKGEELFQFSGRFFTCALKMNPDDGFLWYDLSSNYYHYAQRYGTTETKIKYLNQACKACKHSIKLQPTRWQNWNLLGILNATKEIQNLPIAQHCFIKSLIIDKKAAISWTNLGVLYLSQNEIKLANQAFSRAQQSDTDYVNAWIGQAIVAEFVGQSDDALDLFRHCTQLQFHLESALGYAHWVTSILSDPNSLNEQKNQYAIEDMHAVPRALDSINWYVNAEEKDSSVEALSLLGFLNIKQCLYKAAVTAFTQAVQKADQSEKDKLNCNLGFTYLKMNEPKLAIEAFNSVTEATFKSAIGLALAHFRSTQYEEAFEVYKSALEWLANSDAEKASILVAMSSLVYMFQGENDAKTSLLQCISIPNPPIQALFSVCSVGILHKDMELTKVILDELRKQENDPELCHHIAFLMSEYYASYKSLKYSQRGLYYLISRVHTHPDRPLLRKVLANFLLKHFKKSDDLLRSASKIAESTLVLSLQTSKRTGSNSVDAAHSLATASEAMKHDQRKRLILAQRAIHVHPTCKEAWCALINCRS